MKTTLVRGLAATSVLGTALTTSATAEALPADFYGINTTGKLYQRENLAQHLSAIADHRWTVRRTAPWNIMEPRAPWYDDGDPETPAYDGDPSTHDYDWTAEDTRVEALVLAGVKQTPILAYGTGWADSKRDGFPYVDLHPQAVPYFAAWARAYVERYGRGGAFWAEHPELPYLPATSFEVWNEPNVERFWPGMDPKAYGRLYLEARKAIREADPYARVLVGALYRKQPDKLRAWLNGFFSVPGVNRLSVDDIGFHPYGLRGKASWRLSLRKSEDGLRALRRQLDRRDPSIRIHVNEDGTPVRPGGKEWRRAKYLENEARRLARASGNCGIASVQVFDWSQPEADLSRREDWYGIARPDGTLKRSGAKYLGVTERMTAVASPRPLRLCR